MTLPSSGNPLSIQQINSEFGRGNNLNSYRGTNWYTDSGDFGNFSSNSLGISEFYSKRSTIPTFVISYSGGIDSDIRNMLINSGWNGKQRPEVHLYSTWGSSSVGSPALTISGYFPLGVVIYIESNCYIVGRGGNGGSSSSGNGGSGGLALYVTTPVTIVNRGTIGGGGGGGGGGQSGDYLNGQGGSGGGGGAGYYSGTGGIATYNGSYNLSNGLSGTLTLGGSGGPAGSFGGYGSDRWGGSGGRGGDLGQWGQRGGYGINNWGGFGGSGGSAISGNSYIRWDAVGNIYGAIN